MNWKRLSVIAIDVVLGVYLVLAITAFNKPDDKVDVCLEVPVTIERGVCEGFLTEAEVARILRDANAYPQGQPMRLINTRHIEELLQSNPLIVQAECYKAQNGHVCINIAQRIPVVRVMAQNGDDYSVDTNGELMPPNHYTANLIIATGHITKPYAQQTLTRLCNLIVADPFWRNQVVQVNVLRDGSVELVPRVGEHIAYLGQPVGVQKKLERLRKFYKYGLSEAGWNKYTYVSVEFDNQIICKKHNKVKK